jgi:hypothetical protein
VRHRVGEFMKQIVSDPIGLVAGIVGTLLLLVTFLSTTPSACLCGLLASALALGLTFFRASLATYRQTKSLMAERADRAQAIVRKLPDDAVAFLKMLSEVRCSTTPPRAAGIWGLESTGIVTKERGTGLYRLSDGYEKIIRGLLSQTPSHH